MKLSFVREIIHRNGHKEVLQSHFESESILIGRGGKSEIILTSSLVSLEHAKLSEINNQLIIEDLDSLSGVRVNGVMSVHKAVNHGDEITLGDRTLSIRKKNDIWILEEVCEESVEIDSEEEVREVLRGLAVENTLPRLGLLSLLLVCLIVVPYLILPLFGTNQETWNSGPLASSHQMLISRCQTCHESPFHAVQDSSCTTCHVLHDHAEALPQVFSGHPEVVRRCAECHMEHNGSHGLILSSSLMCAGCHGKLGDVYVETDRSIIPEFDQHPEFRVKIRSDLTSDQSIRVGLDEPDLLVDRSGVKLNHALHLKPHIQGDKGRETLTCASCHKVTPRDGTIQPVTFEQACARCHPLTFDERLPQTQVPHGDPDTVFNYMYAEYAKLYLQEKEVSTDSKNDFDLRRKPGFQNGKNSESKQTEFARQVIYFDTRYSEENLFQRTACQLCHVVTSEKVPQGFVPRSKFSIAKPSIPDRWMPESVFSHVAHDEVSCESCHRGVKKSERTEDVLLPGIERCRSCHTGTAVMGKVKSECTMCHSYHKKDTLSEESRRSISEIVAAVTK